MTAVATAVILAAGRGTRLWPTTAELPKGLLAVAGQRLVHRSVRQLRAAGVQRVVIVAGYRAQDYVATFASDSDVEIVVNRDYEHSGSMGSLRRVTDVVTEEDFLLLESDLLYESRALSAVLGHEGRDVMLISGRTGSGDEVWVHADGGWLAGLSKNASDLGAVTGELVGITRVSQGLLAVMCAVGDAQNGMEYETALVAAADAVPVACQQVSDLVWTEIDDSNHLCRARTVVVPRLQSLGDW